MSDASLNDIYRMVGELTGTVRGLDGKVDDLKKDMSESEATSAVYRQGVRDELGKLVLRTTHLEADMASIKQRQEETEAVTDEVKQVRNNVMFAGRLGRVLWSIGKTLLAASAGAATYWYAMTGRTPP